MKYLAAALFVSVALAGCRSEAPSSSTVCFGLYNPSSDPCEGQMCMQEVQRVTLDTSGASNEIWRCEYCSSVNASNTSTDDNPSYVSINFRTNGAVVSFDFDNRIVSEGYTLASLRNRALKATGTYESAQGKMYFWDVAFEVVSRAGENLRLRTASIPISQIGYTTGTLPRPCEVMGQSTTCTQLACNYGADAPGADGDPTELILDIEAPFRL